MNAQLIREAIHAYHAKTTPDAVRREVGDAEKRGCHQSEADIVWDAAMSLRDILEKETERAA